MTGANFTHIAALAFASKIEISINLNDDYSKATILEKLWNSPYLAGMTNTADALMVSVLRCPTIEYKLFLHVCWSFMYYYVILYLYFTYHLNIFSVAFIS